MYNETIEDKLRRINRSNTSNTKRSGISNVKIAKKIPIKIEVIQITGTDENIKDIQNFCGSRLFKEDSPNSYSVETLEGISYCHAGDWIVKGVEGEMYPIREDIFKTSHDLIS
jgi:hypothetical protein